MKLKCYFKLRHCGCMRAQSLSCVRFCVTPWTAAHQAPLSLGLPRQEDWSRLPFPTPGYLPDHCHLPPKTALPFFGLLSRNDSLVIFKIMLQLIQIKLGREQQNNYSMVRDGGLKLSFLEQNSWMVVAGKKNPACSPSYWFPLFVYFIFLTTVPFLFLILKFESKFDVHLIHPQICLFLAIYGSNDKRS